MVKMLVCSFYNTLVNEEGAISVASMLEIDRIKNKNISFTICTNRHYNEIIYYNKDFPFIEYIISLNGAIIYDVKNKKEIYNKKLTSKKIKLIEEIFKNNSKIYYTNEETYTYNPDKEIYKIEVEVTKKDQEKIENLEINKSILEFNKKKYLEITETSIYEALLYLLKKKKIKEDEIKAIIGNENEKDILTNIKNISLTKNCSRNLKGIVKYENIKIRYKKIEDILKEIE